MKYLFVKMRRDLAGMWKQFLSVLLMAFLGIFIYVGMEGTWYGMETELDGYFANTDLASAWVYGNGMTDEDLQEIQSIGGVTDASLSGLLAAKVKLPGVSSAKEPDLRLNFDTTGQISTPLAVSGMDYEPNGSGLWLDRDFAQAKGLKTGDSLTVSVGDVQKTLPIRGLIMSPEYIYYTGPGTDAMPDHNRHGFAYIGLATAEDIMNETVALAMQKDYLPQLADKIDSAYETAQEKADTAAQQAVDQEFQVQAPGVTDFSSLPQYRQALAAAKAQAESTATHEATQAILKQYDLTAEQFDAVRNLIALPKLQSTDNADRADTAGQFVSLLKKLPDSMLAQNVGGFSLATVKQTPADYNLVRIRTDGKANTTTVEQKVQDILGSRYAGFADRNSMASVHTPVQKVQQIKTMSIMFSLLFFLLALLTMQTTMARLVDTQRIQIGTMKALGFKDGQIRGHYALYGLTVGLLGGLIGLAVAPFTISPVLLHSQTSEFALPEWPVRLTLVSYAMVGAVALCCMLATIFACRKGLAGMPAETMRGIVQKTGRQVFLEKIPRLWQTVSFGWKWTIRDISRNKVRFVMGMVGVLGCMMLLIASFGMQYTCNTLPGDIYGKQYTYQTKILLASSATRENRDALYQTAGDAQWVQETSVDYKDLPDETETLTVVGNGDFVHLENADGAAQQLPNSGVLVTQRAAKLLKLQQGSKVSFRIAGEKAYTAATVSGIVTTASPQGIFVSESAWKKLAKTFAPTSLLAGTTDANSDIGALPYVQEVTTLSNQYDSTVSSYESFNGIFLLLKLAAILLDVVILYNLGLLSFTERTREYATLKVLGFYQKEIRSLALRENLATSLIGWLIGIPVGLWFLEQYVAVVSSSSLELTPQLTLQDFALATVITVGCSVCINLLLSHKVRKIDMVGALKSVE